MDEEARAILRAAALMPWLPRDLGAAIQARFAPMSGVDLLDLIPPRETGRTIPTFD